MKHVISPFSFLNINLGQFKEINSLFDSIQSNCKTSTTDPSDRKRNRKNRDMRQMM